MRTRIPESVKITCDACGLVCSKNYGKGRRFKGGGLTLKRDILDSNDKPVANGGYSFDFCDNCLEQVITSVNEVVKKIKDENYEKD